MFRISNDQPSGFLLNLEKIRLINLADVRWGKFAPAMEPGDRAKSRRNSATISLLSKPMKTINKNSVSGPEVSWLQFALLTIRAAALLSLTACANQNGTNGTMPWYERTPVAGPPPR
jgi:hypothetical protein